MTSQWDRLLTNQGAWLGSFTSLSPAGTLLADISTEVSLQPLDSGAAMRQTIRKYPPGEPEEETTLEYGSVGRGVLFSSTGAFSQGSLQWSPVSDFGAELGLMYQSERLRLVQTFSRQPTLSGLTLIREHLQGTEPTPRSELTLNQLVGTWIGQATTVFPDWQPEQTTETRLTLKAVADHQIEQTLQFGSRPPLQTRGHQTGRRLTFNQRQQPVTVLLLPDGASATFPDPIQPGKPLFLEVGWLIQRNLRQRLIRTYDQRGTLSGMTLVIEHRQH